MIIHCVTQFILQQLFLFYGDLPTDPGIIKRRIPLSPKVVDKLKITLNDTGASNNPLIQFDLYGIPNRKSYKSNPVLDQKQYLECKY